MSLLLLNQNWPNWVMQIITYLQESHVITIGSWNIPILGIIIFSGLFLLIAVIYHQITAKINKKMILGGLHPHFFSGLQFTFKILFMFLTIILFLIFLNVSQEYLVIITSLIITAFSISSIRAINNFVAGIWLILARPFSVGDYIGLLGTKGIVLEITLNYTKILQKDGNIALIPNIDCLRNEITLYTVNSEWFEREIDTLRHAKKIVEKELQTKETANLHLIEDRITNDINELLGKVIDFEKMRKLIKKRKKILDEGEVPLSEFYQRDRLIRYTFSLSLKKEPRRNAQLLEMVCRKWTTRFGLKPIWSIMGLGPFIDYMFIILTPDPQLIISYYDEFVKDIYAAVYSPEIK